jgi:hypothetical protein
MATIPTLMYPESDENIIPQLISWSLASDADLFDVADHCAALVSVLVETDDSETAIALCERLLQALRKLRELCDVDLPPYLVALLIMGGEDPFLCTGLLAGHLDSGGLRTGAGAGGDEWGAAC